jgi:hypothetical protein
MPPTTAATVGSSCTASLVMPRGAFSSSCAIMVASISTCPNSSAPIPKTRSRYLPGRWLFQPWNMYCIATVISPYWPPSTSCSFRAYTASGWSGVDLNWSSWRWKNIILL